MTMTKIYFFTLLGCLSSAGLFGMEPTHESKKRRINSNYIGTIRREKGLVLDQALQKDADFIKQISEMKPEEFFRVINSLRSTKGTYDKLHTGEPAFSYLDELLYAIMYNTQALSKEYFSQEYFQDFKNSLFKIFSEGHALCLDLYVYKGSNPQGPTFEERKASLGAEVKEATAIAEYVLKNYSEKLLKAVGEKITPLIRGANFSDYQRKMGVYEKELAGLEQECLQIQRERPARKPLARIPQQSNKTQARGQVSPEAQRKSFEEGRARRLVSKRSEISVKKKHISYLNNQFGLSKINTILNEFLTTTECLLTNRCWLLLELGQLDEQLLLEIIENYSQPTDPRKRMLIMLSRKFRACGRQDLQKAFIKNLQNYVLNAFSGDAEKESSVAKGYLWEVAVSGFLLENHKNDFVSMDMEVFNKHNSAVSCFVDHVLTDSYIECKNICCLGNENYVQKDAQLLKTKQQLLKELSIARTQQKQLILITKRSLSVPMQQWLKANKIAFLCFENHKQSPLGDASALYQEGRELFF